GESMPIAMLPCRKVNSRSSQGRLRLPLVKATGSCRRMIHWIIAWRPEVSSMMSALRPPFHDHVCLICRGKYPCWQLDCVLRTDIICEDCAEDKEEALLALSTSDVAAVQRVN